MADFGTGYSSLSYLKRFPIDTLNIDRSYGDGLGADAEDTAIVHATVAFARSLDLSVTAGGIENAEQLDLLLKSRGCELGQGYHFGQTAPERPDDRSPHLRPPTTPQQQPPQPGLRHLPRGLVETFFSVPVGPVSLSRSLL